MVPNKVIDDAADYDPFNELEKEFLTLYKYKPKKSNNFFKHHYVSITPKTHQIYLIHAADFNTFNCDDNFEILSKIFIDKYGKSKNYHLDYDKNSGRKSLSIKMAKNMIFVQCGKVFYMNKKYYRQRIEETEELIKEKEENRIKRLNSERNKMNISDF